MELRIRNSIIKHHITKLRGTERYLLITSYQLSATLHKFLLNEPHTVFIPFSIAKFCVYKLHKLNYTNYFVI